MGRARVVHPPSLATAMPKTLEKGFSGQQPVEDVPGAAPARVSLRSVAVRIVRPRGCRPLDRRIRAQGDLQGLVLGDIEVGGPARRKVLHRPPPRRPVPGRLHRRSLPLTGVLHRWAAGAGRWGGGPISPAVDIHLGCRRESPAAAPSASPLWPSGAAANQVAFLVRNSTSSAGRPLRETTSRRAMPRASCWGSRSRAGGPSRM